MYLHSQVATQWCFIQNVLLEVKIFSKFTGKLSPRYFSRNSAKFVRSLMKHIQWLLLKHFIYMSTAWSVQIRSFFSSVFCRFRTEYREISVSLRIQAEREKIQTRKNSVFGHFSSSVSLLWSVHSKTKNELEPSGTSWNELSTTWNKIELAKASNRKSDGI